MEYLEVLKGHIPKEVIDQIGGLQKFEINTELRLAHFLAQCAHESNNFTATKENLNYSASALNRVFKKYFPNNSAIDYARKPEEIANRVYADRMGNGDEASGDGFKFRGRGYIQLTGYNNYLAFSRSIEIDCIARPDLVSDSYPLLSAAWFFDTNGITKLSDRGPTSADVKRITKRVNGGYHGLDDRIKHFDKIYALLI